MENLSPYEQHLRFMQGVNAIGDIEEEGLSTQFDILLSCIPNGGKLYKYRSLCGKSFKYIYDSLANGYLWLPAAKDLNDDYDSALIEDAERANKLFVDYITRDKDVLIYSLLKQYGSKYWDREDLLKCIPFSDFLDVFDPVTGKMDTVGMASLFRRYGDEDKRFGQFQNVCHCLLQDFHSAMKQYTAGLFFANILTRDSLHVYAMSESYDLGNMWGYYADSGRGFCIEYDYSRAKSLDVTAMHYLISTFKVNYTDTPQGIPAELLAEANIFQPDNPNVLQQMQCATFDQILTKEKCWENEREWRIVLGNIDCKIPVDIVSAIIIDERALNKTNAKKLIRLCKKHDWTVKVRKSHIHNTFHSYEDLDVERKHDE